MTKLETLINDLCPNGVKKQELCQFLTIRNGNDYKGFGTGNIPVYGSGGIMTYIDTYSYDKPSVLIPRKGSINKLYYVDTPFWNVDTIYYTEIDITKAIPKYVYHCLLREHLEQYNVAGGVPSLTQKVLNQVTIPLPPLPVQEEIVRILDSYTKMTEELESKLKAELEARKKQYEFYRDSLLKFDTGGGSRGAKWEQLQNISDIGTGSHNTNEELEKGSYPFFVRSQDVRRLNSFDYDEEAIITSGDGVGVGKIYHYVHGKYALHQRAYRIHINTPNVLPKFFYYYMKTTFLPYIEKNAFNSSVTSIRRPMLNSYPVPIIPIKEQERIVKILDRFDKLCNDLTEGLPAEIESRRKQYEYYRDKLLTFTPAQ